MSQLSETSLSVGVANKMEGLLSALKTGLKGGVSSNSMFASLLAETRTSLPPVERQAAPERKQSFVHLDAHKDKSNRDNRTSVRAKEEVSPMKDSSQEARRANEESAASTKKESVQNAPCCEGAVETTETEERDLNVASEKTQAKDEPEKMAEHMVQRLMQQDPELSKEEAESLVAFVFEAIEESGNKPQAKSLDEGVAKIDGAEEGGLDLLKLEALLNEHLHILRQNEAKMEGQQQARIITPNIPTKVDEAASLVPAFLQDKDGLKLDERAGLATGLSDEDDGEGLWLKSVREGKAEAAGQKTAAKQQGQEAMATTLQNRSPAQAHTPAPVVSAPVAQALGATASTMNLAGERGGHAPAAVGATTNATTLGGEAIRPMGIYDFASQLSATRAARGGAAGLPQAVEQIAVQLHKAVKEGKTEMTLHLRPAELGRVEIKLQFGSHKQVTGVVIVDNPSTLNLLQKDSEALVRALQNAGLEADAGSMEFTLRDEGQLASQRQQDGREKAEGRRAQVSNESVLAAGNDDDEAEEIYYLTPGRVNLRV